jgi:hypothetical protein
MTRLTYTTALALFESLAPVLLLLSLTLQQPAVSQVRDGFETS